MSTHQKVYAHMIGDRIGASFWRHESKNAGYATLYCRISIAGERADIGSTGVKIRFEDWDSAGEKVLDRDPEAHFKNDKLLTIKLHLSAIFNELFRAQETITAGKVKRLYQKKGGHSISLLSAFDLYLKDSKKDRERDLSKASLVVYDNCRKKVIDFLLAQKAADLPVDEFDLTWLKNYRKWMKSVELPGNKTGHADSYISKHSQIIKNVLTWAKLNKHTDRNPLFRKP